MNEAFLVANKFELEEEIDPHVKRYFGSFVTLSARQLLEKTFGVGFNALVWINCNDNSDFDCSPTSRVEIGVKERETCAYGTFGVFGASSPFCGDVDLAYEEAARDLLYKVLIVPKGLPGIVCWRRRMN
jgi:hypothetical protein